MPAEEGFPAANASFSGSFGLLNPFGVPKPGYRLMQLLAGMGPTRLPVNFSAAASADTCTETVGALAGRNATHVLVVLYNHAQRTAPIRGCSVRLDLQRANGDGLTLWGRMITLYLTVQRLLFSAIDLAGNFKTGCKFRVLRIAVLHLLRP